MLILGIESSCDETAAAVVENARRVRSSVVASQTELHAEFGGVVPELAGRAHVERIVPVIRKALDDAGTVFEDLDAVAVGHRPGLIGSLLVGVSAAKAIAWSLGVPLVGVDHVHAHLFAPLLGCGHETDVFPAIGLVVSGGHTSLYRLDSPTTPRRLGGTIDDALGEVYDKVASILGLPYPGGPAIDRLAADPDADDRAAEFPVSRLKPGSLDFSFSGLKTAVLYEVRGRPAPSRPGKPAPPPPPPMTEQRRRDIAASFQRAALRAITLKLGRALDANADCAALLVGGGVSANTRLRAELGTLCAQRGVALRMAPGRYCVDNAAMIAGLGAHLLEAGAAADLSLAPVPTTAC